MSVTHLKLGLSRESISRPVSSDSAQKPNVVPAEYGPWEPRDLLSQSDRIRVWRVSHAKTGQLAVVKELLSPLPGGSHLKDEHRFLKEAMLAQKLRHPGLAGWLDGRLDGPRPWMALETLPDSHDLSHHTTRPNLLAVRRVVRLGAQFAEVLHWLHGQGLVHRDVKPSNLLFSAVRPYAVKLLDLGITCRIGAGRSRKRLVGSPRYVSPEQALGLPLGPSSDLYSLGVSLHELLLGCRPYDASSLPALLRQIIHGKVQDMPFMQADIPPSLRDILRACLALHPAERPASAVVLARQLSTCLRGLV